MENIKYDILLRAINIINKYNLHEDQKPPSFTEFKTNNL